MLKHLLTLFIALTVFTGKAWADEPTVTFIVPYKVVCEKQPDGTKQIRVKVALRKAPHQFIVNSVENLISTANPGVTIYNDTTLLQATDPCRNLSGELALTNKLYGFDAELIGDEVNATFGFLFDSFPIDLCAFLINVNLSCCGKTLEESLAGKVYLDEDETIAWVDLGNIDITKSFSNNENLMLANAPYASDGMLRNEQFDPTDTTILLTLYNLAVKNLHGQPCCFETFGLDDQNAQRILCDLVSKLNGCPTEFTGTGTWGSCGDTQNVKLTGTMTKPIIIDVCGKKLCLTELPAVKDSTNLTLTTPGSQTAACFSEFFIGHLSFFKTLEKNGNTFDPAIGQCGIPTELPLLVQGRKQFFNGELTDIYTLRLICVDAVNHIYAFGSQSFNVSSNEERLIILGCRFKLDDCPKCCK